MNCMNLEKGAKNISHENTMSKNFGLLLRGGHINLIGAGTALALMSFQ